MPRDDDDPEKWRMKEHTEIKHEILRKYFVSWVRVISSKNRRLHFFDGFAGRGYYEDGEEGSPLLIMEAADENSDYFDDIYCTFVDLNDNNFQNLNNAIEEKKQDIDTDKITTNTENDEFEAVANDLVESLGDEEIIPSFFFIDPFGYESIPFETVSKIANIQDSGVEIFITFMIRDIRRFVEDEGHEDSITRILGTDKWKKVRSSEDREQKILQIYENQLRNEAGVNYVWPFEMRMPDRRETVYHLIHATNHFKGFKIMKDIMFNSGAEDQFAYLGPEHYGYEDQQATLFDTTGTRDDRVSELADFLFDTFEGEKLSFYEIMKRTYPETDLIEKHYRRAVYYLEDRHKAKIDNQPDQPDGTKAGLDKDDIVKFEQQYGDLSSWC